MRTSSKAGLPATVRPVRDDVAPNQWVGNPKQERFVRLYMDPTSETFGNAFQSAVQAGYKESYSRIIVSKQIGNQWVKQYHDLINLEPEHIVAAIQSEAMNKSGNRGSERLKALEMLAKMKGMLVERSVVGHVNIEQAINELI
jgi:phage terminase small subunit